MCRRMMLGLVILLVVNVVIGGLYGGGGIRCLEAAAIACDTADGC